MNPGRPRTSIVIGTYNGGRYLGAQLDSIAAQTCPPLEVIVADDGSRDDTVAVAQAFAARTPFPVVVGRNADNLGFGENFLRAALRSAGAFVAFCDQDDHWRPDKIALCEAALDADPNVALVVHPARLIDGEGRPVGAFRQGIDRDRTRPPLSYGAWDGFFGFSMTFRRELLTIAPLGERGIDYITGQPRLAHDRWILFVANLVGSTRELAEPLVDYRQHGGNLFGSGYHGGGVTTRSRTRRDSDRYLLAAGQQRALVDRIAAYPDIGSWSFDGRAAADFYDRTLSQQRARNRLYKAGRIAGVAHWLRNLIDGSYRLPESRRFRHQAAVKDLLYLLAPERPDKP